MDKKKILVVEDEKAISDILVFNLQREGYDTLAAYDGAEGLRCALEEAPDLILLDVMLPEMDGFEVCRRVRAEKDTPIIMLYVCSINVFHISKFCGRNLSYINNLF